MKLIVGLGNPGDKYDRTRHNIGFEVIDAFAHKIDVKIKKLKFQGLLYKGDDYILLKPQTFMNNSGDCLQAIVKFFKIAIEDILIIYDDMDHEVGNAVMKPTGSAGGQNGMKDIISKLGTNNITRIKVGIGRGHNSVNHVLGNFSKVEVTKLKEITPSIFDAINTFIDGDTNKAMLKINTKTK